MNSEIIRIPDFKGFPKRDQCYLAEGIIEKLNEIICIFGVARIGDFYDICEDNELDVPERNYSQYAYGWTKPLTADCIKIGYEEYEVPKFEIIDSEDNYMWVWSKKETKTRTKTYYYLELPPTVEIW